MLKKISIVCIFFSLVNVSTAAPVSTKKAEQVALNWYRMWTPRDVPEPEIRETISIGQDTLTVYYVFKFKQGGFVIVSGDDATVPVIGYSFDSEFIEGSDNDAIKGWFEFITSQILHAIEERIDNSETRKQWNDILSPNGLERSKLLQKRTTVKEVSPLVRTKWDQGTWYNEMCPSDPEGPGGHALVGCTGVAMGQIMEFWNYPEAGIGQIEYIGKTVGAKYGLLSVFFNETRYEWSNMPDSLTSSNSAVATLLYHCAASAKTDFGPTSSGAYLSNVATIGLLRHFDYSPSLQYLLRSDYADEAWLALMKEELNSGRPVLYEGYNAARSLGHAMVCDGYQGNDYFHFNWGWSGYVNGYYYLNNLTPGFYTFTYHQRAIVGIQPNNSPLAAKFEVKETPTLLEYQFVDYSTAAPTSRFWEFGDGSTSTELNPIHGYAAAGTYSVSFTVTKNGVQRTTTVQQALQTVALSDIQASIGAIDGKVLWGDYDNDSDLDALMVGYPLGVRLYRNDNGDFTEVNTGITGGGFSFQPQGAAWGDYDNDGNLDLLLWGVLNYLPFTKLYRNDGGTFVDINARLIGANRFSTVLWTDYDSDGDLDMFFCGPLTDYDQNRITKIYRNHGGKYVDTGINFPVVSLYSGDATWFDYDNDGDLDVFFYGGPHGQSSGRFCKIFQNDNGIFTEINLAVPVAEPGSAVWSDYDNDGDLDLLIVGTYQNQAITKLYRNDGDSFVDINAGLQGASGGYQPARPPIARWVDFDNNGWEDIALTGYAGENRISKLYRNVQGVFVDVGARTDISYSTALWFDHENDGDLDVLDGNKLFRNDEGTFVESSATIADIDLPTKALGDYDNDGDLDLLMSGYKNGVGFLSRIYRNNAVQPNLPPSIPSALSYSVNGSEASLSWNPSNDDRTPQNDLTYNVFVGTSPASGNVLSAMSDLNTGARRVVQEGNTAQRKSQKLNNLVDGTYYFSVQAIDNSFASSAFAALAQFTVAGGNIPPTSLDVNKEAYVNTELAFQESDFTSSFVDPEDSSLSKIKITSLPFNGTLKLDGVTVIVGQEIPRGDLGKLTYRPAIFADDTLKWRGFDGLSYSSADGFVKISVNLYKDISAGLQAVPQAFGGNDVVCWGDYDNDGDLDLLILGQSSQGAVPKLYRNHAGTFVETDGVLRVANSDGAAWGDYDNDGDLDLVFMGETSTGLFSKIYRNENGNFVDINAGLIGVRSGMVAWGDYNNDGDLDLFLCGICDSNNNRTSKIYRNDNGLFVDVEADLPGVNVGSVAWGDYDNDGDLDILLTGSKGTTTDVISEVFRNDNGKFVDINAGLINLYQSSAEWGDYDDDGDLDILLSGISEYGFKALRIYRNDNGSFSFPNEHAYVTTGWNNYGGSATWGDYDNDGDLDVLMAGSDIGNNAFSKIYENNQGFFTEEKVGLPNVSNGKGVFADYNNDGYLDILLIGLDKDNEPMTAVFRNCLGQDSFVPNTHAVPPTSLKSSILNEDVTLSWDKATDLQTPQGALTYNIRMGTMPQGVDRVSPMSNVSTGFRQVIQIGNVGFRNSYTVKGLADGTYYWSVQTVDGGFMGSVFANEATFMLRTNHPPIIVALPDTVAYEDSMYTSKIYAIDPDTLFGDVLTYRLSQHPTWLAIDSLKGILSGIPRAADVGVSRVIFLVDDQNGGITQGEFNLEVVHTEHAPLITSVPDTIAYEDSLYQYLVRAYDVDAGDTLQFSLLVKPSWLSVSQPGTNALNSAYDRERVDIPHTHKWGTAEKIDDIERLNSSWITITSIDTTLLLSGIPGAKDVGDTVVSVQVSDGQGGAYTQTFTLHVLHTNHPPTAVVLYTPAHRDTLALFYPPKEITFAWGTSQDVDEGDSVRYIFKLMGGAIDTTISNLNDTTLTLDIMSALAPATSYEWFVQATDGIVAVSSDTFLFVTSAIVLTIDAHSDLIPKEFALYQNYPNPFNLMTIIRYQLPVTSKVTLSIYNVLGRVVATPVDEVQDAGYKSVEWNTVNLPSSVYFLRMVAEPDDNKAQAYSQVRKLVMIK